MDYINGIVPECKPLYTLREVLDWNKTADWSKFVVGLKNRSIICYSGTDVKCSCSTSVDVKIIEFGVPKTLVCHDMKGGYLSDRYVDGTNTSNEYVFYHWSVIDIFVYFSHHLVTIPPLMWINAAHNHGVKILGTLITESEDGAKLWDEVLANREKLLLFADKLAAICTHYKFDGYLVNIENRIDESKLQMLLEFLETLKGKLPKSSLVIWYDSVSLQSGELLWQNELNLHNKKAFTICDGIFLNYTWNETNLKNARIRAGARNYDVFVGVDVFGRGCYGGGGYNSDKAVAYARTFGLSVALFGIGWTHEVEAANSDFFQAERKFWSKLWPLLYIYSTTKFPFKTTFCQGYGKRMYNKGKLVDDEPWFNLSQQSFQPTIPSCLSDSCDIQCIYYNDKDAFTGGGCIVVTSKGNLEITHRILACNFVCADSTPIKLTIASKWPATYSPFDVIIGVENVPYVPANIILTVAREQNDIDETKYQNDYSSVTHSVIQKSLAVPSYNNWSVSEFVFNVNGHITSISIKTADVVYIGFLSLKRAARTISSHDARSHDGKKRLKLRRRPAKCLPNGNSNKPEKL